MLSSMIVKLNGQQTAAAATTQSGTGSCSITYLYFTTGSLIEFYSPRYLVMTFPILNVKVIIMIYTIE